MSAADKLRDLHERSQYQSGVSIANSLAVQQDACITAASLLPDIIAVIEAAETINRLEAGDTFPGWFDAYAQATSALSGALTALSARLA